MIGRLARRARLDRGLAPEFPARDSISLRPTARPLPASKRQAARDYAIWGFERFLVNQRARIRKDLLTPNLAYMETAEDLVLEEVRR